MIRWTCLFICRCCCQSMCLSVYFLFVCCVYFGVCVVCVCARARVVYVCMCMPTSTCTCVLYLCTLNKHVCLGAYCGKFSGLSGIVKSPTRDPLTGLYPPNTRCDYRIKTPRGYTIRATFNEFNLQWSSYCQSDYVKHTQIKNKWNDRAYCGQHLKGRTVETCDNRLFIRFVSDSVRNGKGFNMAYTAVGK